MIEISAKLVGGPVYLPGDSIGCCITFINKSTTQGAQHNQYNNFEILAWSSAQIHCSCVTSDKLIPPEEIANGTRGFNINSDTSFVPHKDDSGYIVFSTKPKIILCDLKLATGESKSFLYTETLQNEIPPSYRGQLVKYSYKLTIGTQRVNNPIKLLRIPLRILVIDGFPEISACEDSVDLSPSNPFLDICEKDKELEPALQVLQNITARRNANFYNITNARGNVAQFCLFKMAYKLGEDIIGTFNFDTSTVPCVQFIVILQCEEIISEKYKIPGKRDHALASYSKCSEFCLNMNQCFLNIPIPLHITPAFTTNIVSLKWKLHFEFVTSSKPPEEVEYVDNYNKIWHAPKSMEIETMVWDLPIQIYPTTTISDLHTQTKSYLVI